MIQEKENNWLSFSVLLRSVATKDLGHQAGEASYASLDLSPSAQVDEKMENEKGQVLLLMLLVMGVSLMVGLAASSRSINFLKQTVNTGDALTCLNSAEAGVEDAFQALSDPAQMGSLTFCNLNNLVDGSWDEVEGPDTNIKVCDLQASTCGDSSKLSDPLYDVAYCIAENKGEVNITKVLPDETYQVPLRLTSNTLTNIDLHWSEGSATPVFSVIGTNATTGVSQKLDVGAFDPAPTDGCDFGGGDDHNDPASASASLLIVGGKVINIPLPPPSGSYPSDRLDLRFRLLCSGADQVIITGKDSSGTAVSLPTYAHTVRSTCINQIVKKEIEATKWLPALPAIFDLGVYSGSSTGTFGP